MSSYIKKLSADLPRWVGMGLVTDTNAQAILKDAEAQQGQGWFTDRSRITVRVLLSTDGTASMDALLLDGQEVFAQAGLGR